VATKLERMGMPVEEHHIFTCAMATARFLARQKPNGTAYVIGEGGLLNALHSNGYSVVDKSPDYVVVGEGRTLSFEMLEHAVQMVIDGAKLIATNLDPNCPTQRGTRPGCGAIVSLIESATGIKAFSVGKPSPVMMRTARKELGMATSETIMIGDTMETDILGGVQMGYRTVLVLTGTTTREDLSRYAYQPDVIVDSIADLCDGDRLLNDMLPLANREDDTPHDIREWVCGPLVTFSTRSAILRRRSAVLSARIRTRGGDRKDGGRLNSGANRRPRERSFSSAGRRTRLSRGRICCGSSPSERSISFTCGATSVRRESCRTSASFNWPRPAKSRGSSTLKSRC
jgi:NagD protein